MTKVKICGIRRIEDVAYVNTYKPEYIGFVFAPGRKRTVTFEQAHLLKTRLSNDIKVVGVFVNAKQEEIVSLVNAGVIDIIQLHGDEDEGYVASLREKTAGVSIIKAFVIDNEAAIVRANAFPCDYLLLDGGLGQGEKFDWKLISKMERPFFLAGGLSADNVNEAIKTTKPFAVDVSSGVETEGFKDSKKIKHFIDKVREEI